MRRGGKFYRWQEICKFPVYFIRFSQYNRDNEFEERGTGSQTGRRGGKDAIMISIKDTILEGKKHIHLIGIGGSGMYPIVQILHGLGFTMSGSDNNPGETIEAERALGIPVTIGQKAENIAGADLIVHTAAIMEDNPELVAARQSGVPTIERMVLLGLISRWFEDCICVCGTHGKTTTTSMLTQILLENGMDPSAVVGGKLDAIHGSGRLGKSPVMVCEACEFADHFLQLDPDVAVILNVDADHLDYFKTLDNVIASFHKFAQMANKAVIYNGDDPNTCKAVEGVTGKKLISYGKRPENDYYPENIQHHGGSRCGYDLMHQGKLLGHVELSVPGEHNVLNSIGAIAAALEVGCGLEGALKAADSFKGAHRRFEIMGVKNGVTIADDYGHHPAELEVTLRAAKEMDYKRVWAVHQPFTYSRTAMLLDDFARVLQLADRVVLSEIMGSREKNTYNIYSKDLAEKIPGCVWFPTLREVADYVMANAQPGDLVITMGCGDVYKCARMMLDEPDYEQEK